MSNLIEQLKRHVGFKEFPYEYKTGYWIIGFKFNINEHPIYKVSDFEKGITLNQAEALLSEDLHEAKIQLLDRLPDMRDLSQVRQDCLINLVFSMGIDSFAGSRIIDNKREIRGFQDMIRAIRHGNFEEAAKELLNSKWGQEINESRVNEIAKQLETGIYFNINSRN